MERYIYNGQLVSPNQLLFFSGNRSFRYGDGLFETMRFLRGNIFWLDYHLQRLHRGMRKLGFAEVEMMDRNRLLSDLERLHPPDAARIRLSVFRSGGGAYRPETDRFEYLMEAAPLEDDTYVENTNGLKLMHYREHYLPTHDLSNLKTASALPYVLAARQADQQGCDDALLYNQHGRICEATASNVFLLREKRMLTPPLTEGCLAGTMRRVVFDLAARLHYHIVESPLTPELLSTAESVWLTNSIRGIRWVRNVDAETFIAGPLLTFVNELNQLALAE